MRDPDAPPLLDRFWKEALLLALAVLLAYFPTFWNGFVYDDENYILLNPSVRGPLDLPQIFSENYPRGAKDQGLYRPLVTLSYCLDGKLWGFALPRSWNGFHLTNLLLHALNAILLLALLRHLGLSAGRRLVAVLIFTIHPILTESVAWIVGRAELMGMAFGLLGILSFLKWPRGLGLVATCFFWILALLCKEHWMMLPALIFLICVCMPSAPKFRWPDFLKLGVLAAVLGGGFWWVRFLILGSWHSPVAAYGSIPTFSRMATALEVLWKYVGLWLWPVHLSIHHEIELVSSPVLGGFLFASWLAAFWIVWRLRLAFPWLALAFGWYWIAMLPVSNFLIPIGTVSGERFLYFGTLFFAPIFVLVADKALSFFFRESVREVLSPIGIGILCMLLFVRLWFRTDDWTSNLTLWQSASRVYPESYGIKAQLAISLLREQRFAEAHIVADEALKQSEKRPQPYQKYFNPRLRNVNAMAQSGMSQMLWVRKFEVANDAARNLRLREALETYRELVRDFPEEPQPHEALGDLYYRLNNYMGAKQQFEEAIRLGAKTSTIYAKYAQSLSELGKKAEALLAYDQALKINPRDAVACYNRGVVLGDLGDYEGALYSFRLANKAVPDFAAPHLNAAAILIHLKRYDQAKAELAPVLALDPKQPEALALFQKIAQQTRKVSG